jgi:hypothetical protein
MANDSTGSGGGGSGRPADDRDVYKTRSAERAERAEPAEPMTDRAHRNVTDLMAGVSGAMAEAARTFGDTLRDRAQADRPRPTDVVEAGALSASRMFAALAESWQGFYDNLVRDHRAAQTVEPIDYDRLATLVAEKLRAGDKPTKV